MKRILLFTAFFAFGVTLMAQSNNGERIGRKSVIHEYEIIDASNNVIESNKFLNTTCSKENVVLYTNKNSSAKSAAATPTALYRRPDGHFYLGLSAGYLQLSNKRIIGPAFLESTWTNKSKDATSYEWSVQDPYSSSQIKLSDADAKLYYPNGDFTMPKLTAKNSSGSNTYTWASANRGGRTLQMGGSSSFMVDGYDTSFGFTTYDPTCEKVYHKRSAAENDFAYGTTSDNSIVSVGNIFEKPAKKYIVKGGYVSLAFFTAPADTEFKLIFHKIDDKGNPKEVIATATCKASDVIKRGTAASPLYALPFRKGFIKKGETKLSSTIEIDETIFVELTGFNDNSKITLAAFTQENNTSPDQVIPNARIYKKTGTKTEWTYYTESDEKTPLYTSVLIHLDAEYNFLGVKNGDAEFKVSKDGGSKTFDIATFYDPSSWILSEESLPKWLTAKVAFNSSTWKATITLTAEPLPSGTSERIASVKYVSDVDGEVLTLNVDQNLTNSISEDQMDSKIQVVNKTDVFELSYPVEYTSVSVYNVAGQLVGSYMLPNDGEFSIPSYNLTKGVYLFKFMGKSVGETVKVIK